VSIPIIWGLLANVAGLATYKLPGGNRLAGPSFSDAQDIDAVKRVLAQAERNIHAEMKRGLGDLATIASTAPLVGLFGTVIGIMDAFKGCSAPKSLCIAATASGISEALVLTAVGLFVAVPALWSYNYFTSTLETFDVETANSSMELAGYLVIHLALRKQIR
jgi:biopolymer transport protein ExbB/biopolymer transport protein TolQ